MAAGSNITRHVQIILSLTNNALGPARVLAGYFQTMALRANRAQAQITGVTHATRQLAAAQAHLNHVQMQGLGGGGGGGLIAGGGGGRGGGGGAAGGPAGGMWALYRGARAALFVFEGFKGVAGTLMGINQQFEDMELAFAGTMRAKGLTDSFTNAQGHAKNLIDELRRYAAVLPGSLRDYVDVARVSYGQVAQAGLSSTAAQAKFISRFGAVAMTMMVGPKQAGRDLMHMLTGNIRSNTLMWSLLNDQIGLSVQQWKELTKPQRAALLDKALNGYNDALKAAENTWSAIGDTFASHMQEVSKLAFAPAFEHLKSVFKDINEYLNENKEFMASFVRNAAIFAGLMGAGAGADYLTRRRAHGTGSVFANGLLPVLTQMPIGRLWARMSQSMGFNYLSSRAVGTRMMGAPLVGGMFQTMAGSGGRMAAMFRGMSGFVAGFLAIAGPLLALSLAAGSLLVVGSAIYLIMTNFNGLRDVLSHTIDVIWALFDPFFAMISSSGDKAGGMETAKNGIAALTAALAEFLKYILQFVGTLSGYIGAQIAHFVGMQSALVSGNVGQAYEEGKNFTPMNQVKEWIEIWNQIGAAAEKAATVPKKGDGTLDPLKTPPDRNAAPQYNFPNARFNITQQFAEGADPDRVAVTFAEDVRSMAERRIASQLAPGLGGI